MRKGMKELSVTLPEEFVHSTAMISQKLAADDCVQVGSPVILPPLSLPVRRHDLTAENLQRLQRELATAPK